MYFFYKVYLPPCDGWFWEKWNELQIKDIGMLLFNPILEGKEVWFEEKAIKVCLGLHLRLSMFICNEVLPKSREIASRNYLLAGSWLLAWKIATSWDWETVLYTEEQREFIDVVTFNVFWCVLGHLCVFRLQVGCSAKVILSS